MDTHTYRDIQRDRERERVREIERERERERECMSTHVLTLPTSRVGIPISINLIQNIHWQAQSLTYSR